MKRVLVAVIALLVCLSSWAKYEELVALQQWTEVKLKERGEVLSQVPTKYVGVREFGRSLAGNRPLSSQRIEELTEKSTAYWRANFEMSQQDPSVLFVHGYLLTMIGEIDQAQIYFELGTLSMDETLAKDYQAWRRLAQDLRERVALDVVKGIKYHDKGKYKKAIATFDKVLAQYPACGWALYEKGQSYMLWELENKKVAGKAEDLYGQCRLHSPFRWQAYQGSDAKVIGLFITVQTKVLPFFQGKNHTLEGLHRYADGLEEMELYGLAAHARWKLAALERADSKDQLRAMLDHIQKAGCPDMATIRSYFTLEDEPVSPHPVSE